MSFIWPGMLVFLVGVPLLVVAYLALMRRRERRAADLAAQGFAPTASACRLRRVRHVPFAFFLAAVVLLLLALARPETSLSIPHREGTVVLAFDVSNSMLAEDFPPTRMEAAKAAARTFVAKQPKSIKIGVVVFSNGGLVTQEPTNVTADVMAAVDRLAPQGGTSLGQGIFAALSAVAGKPITPTEGTGGSIDDLDIGYLGSAAVVLLSDGENNGDPDPLDVAELASVAGVHIYPIGIGSAAGTVVDVGGFSVATALDEDLLTSIASATDGTYFRADDAAALADIYNKIDLRLTSDTEKTEVTGVVTGISALLLVVGGALSLLWFGRLV